LSKRYSGQQDLAPKKLEFYDFHRFTFSDVGLYDVFGVAVVLHGYDDGF
jgi:hypothetical protein